MLDLAAAAPGASGDGKAPAGAGSRSKTAEGRPVLVSLVPSSSLQFLDFEMSEEAVALVRRRFLEIRGEGGEPALHVAAPGEGMIFDPVTGLPGDPARTYSIGGSDALAPFLGAWLPLPVMRVGRSGEGEAPVLDEGPSNWVRAHVTRQAGNDGAGGSALYRVVIAIDTAIDPAPAPNAVYASPTIEDLRSGEAFRFSDSVDDVAWFVSEAWVDDWVKDLFDTHTTEPASARRAPEPDDGPALKHLAHYLTVLAVLKQACDIPVIRFLEPAAVGAYAETVPVDLALDLGTSRTLALIGEQLPPAAGQRVAPRVTALEIRDLSEPWRIHRAPLSSRLSFARTSFGNEALSRWSGRTQAFQWPIPARIGEEAERLAAAVSGPDAQTGVSSPLHYVWDERPTRDVWRFAGAAADGGRASPIVSGTLLSLISEAGELLEAGGSAGLTTKPRFSRSALTTFLVAEILMHAVSAINAPHQREAGGRPLLPRRLDRLVVVPPAAMGDAEVAILRQRVETAVKLVWQALGWQAETNPLAPPQPRIVVGLDAATATSLAWLESEVAYKFRGRADGLLALLGKPRTGFAGARTLRVASVDIGGATTGVSVATCEMSGNGAIALTRQLVDGFDIGCDDAVKALAERVVVPALAHRLSECKHAEPMRLLRVLLATPDARARPAWVGDLGRRLVREMLAPAATGLLRLYVHAETDAGDAPTEISLATLLASVGADAQAVADRLDVLAADEGADGFSPLDVSVPFLMRDLDEAARAALRPMLEAVARVLAALDCDVVLLTGRGSELPVVRRVMLETMPTRPDRLVLVDAQRLAGLRVAGLEPGQALTETKAMPAFGALAEARGGFPAVGLDLVVRPLDRVAGMGFVGPLGPDGRIATDDVLFEGVAGASAPAYRDVATQPGRRQRPVSIALPQLFGIRIPSIESWPARPRWEIDRDPGFGGRAPKLPVKVTLDLVPSERGRTSELRLLSAVDGDGGRLDPGEIGLRLKTRRFTDGYWMDTGLLDLGSEGAAV